MRGSDKGENIEGHNRHIQNVHERRKWKPIMWGPRDLSND